MEARTCGLKVTTIILLEVTCFRNSSWGTVTHKEVFSDNDYMRLGINKNSFRRSNTTTASQAIVESYFQGFCNFLFFLFFFLPLLHYNSLAESNVMKKPARTSRKGERKGKTSTLLTFRFLFAWSNEWFNASLRRRDEVRQVGQLKRRWKCHDSCHESWYASSSSLMSAKQAQLKRP